MAYQNVGTPRFFINVLEWLASNDAIVLSTDRFRTLPVSVEDDTGYWAYGSTSPANIFSGQSFFAILGITVVDETRIIPTYTLNGVTHWLGQNYNTVLTVNCDYSTGTWTPATSGFAIGSLNGGGEYGIGMRIDESSSFGSIVLGTYYDMPHSPDLSLTMTREYGGVKTIETKGGSTLSNAFYTKPPMWGGLAAWELEAGGTQQLAKSGRRVWDLSFSYLQDSDVFPTTSSLTRTGEDGYTFDDDTHLDNTLLYHDNFYSQVIHRTNGGQLPFIFQPDNSNSKPDQFAICKLDMKSFKFEQVANSVYNVKLKIREVW